MTGQAGENRKPRGSRVRPENVIQVEAGMSGEESAPAKAVKIGECVRRVGRCGEEVVRLA